MGLFKVSTKWEGTLPEDLNNQISEINKKIPIALQAVGSEMMNSLQQHLSADWYSAWKPKEYPRRKDHPEYQTGNGLSIMDRRNMSADVQGNTLVFQYEVSGDHVLHRYHKRDGDVLIESIQKGTLAGNAPPRPFWNRFVSDQLDHGGIMTSFAATMRPYQVILQGGRLDIDAEPNESMLGGSYKGKGK